MQDKVLFSPWVCSYWMWCCSTGSSRCIQKEIYWRT